MSGWERRYAHVTKVTHYTTLRRILRWLWEEHGAPKLDRYVPRLTGVRPRNVTATREQIDTLIQSARPAMRLWLLFCTDLGIRSGTAITLGPDHYRADNQSLSFVTKKGAHQTLPITAAIAAMLQTCDLDSRLPFVTQLRVKETGKRGRPMKNDAVNIFNLRQEFKALRVANGIHKRIVPHDLRRTAAVNLLRLTGDVTTVQSLLGHRTLQSTIWYLDHDLKPLDRTDLEAIKKPFIVWRKDAKTA